MGSPVARELVWETTAAARSLLGFLAAQRTIGTDVFWNGLANDPLLTFPEHHPTLQGSYTWRLRFGARVRGAPDVAATLPGSTPTCGSALSTP